MSIAQFMDSLSLFNVETRKLFIPKIHFTVREAKKRRDKTVAKNSCSIQKYIKNFNASFLSYSQYNFMNPVLYGRSRQLGICEYILTSRQAMEFVSNEFYKVFLPPYSPRIEFGN